MALTIAAGQAISARGDVEANLLEHERLIRLAAEHDARVIVFPELSLTGYELDLARSLAFSENDGRLDSLREAASNHRMIVIVGAPIQCSSGLHLGAFIVHPDGSVGVYTKHHLHPGEEDKVFQPGDRNPLIKLGSRTAAVAICADTTHRSHLRNAAERGADIYLAGVFLTPPGFDPETESLIRRATEDSMTVAIANSGGPASGSESHGNSSVWSATGDLVARIDGQGSGVVIATQTDAGWTGQAVRPI